MHLRVADPGAPGDADEGTAESLWRDTAWATLPPKMRDELDDEIPF